MNLDDIYTSLSGLLNSMAMSAISATIGVISIALSYIFFKRATEGRRRSLSAIARVTAWRSAWLALSASWHVLSMRSDNTPKGKLVDIFMPPDRAEDVVYNLLGRYDYWVQTHGRRWANFIFLLQSLGAIVTFYADWMLKRIKLLKMFVSS